MVNYDHPVLACAWREDQTRSCRMGDVGRA